MKRSHRSKFWIRFSYFKNAMDTLSPRFHKVAVRYYIVSYDENVEKFCACTKFCDVHSVWLYVSYTVSISWHTLGYIVKIVTNLHFKIKFHIVNCLCERLIPKLWRRDLSKLTARLYPKRQHKGPWTHILAFYDNNYINNVNRLRRIALATNDLALV